MDDSQTPRGLVESLITHSRLDETVRNSTIDTSTNKGKKRVLSGKDSKDGKKKKAEHSRTLSESTITPRTMIEGFVQGDNSIQHSTRTQRKKRRVSLNTTAISTTSKNSVSSSSKRTGNLRKKITMRNFLNRSLNTGPTPRGLIEGFLQHGAESTPVVLKKDTDRLNSTDREDVEPRRKRMRSLGESYYLPSTAPEMSSHTRAGTREKRYRLNAEDIVQKLNKRRDAAMDATPNISVTTNLADTSSLENQNTGASAIYEKTEELKRKMSSRQASMMTSGGELTMPSVSELETPKVQKSPQRISRSSPGRSPKTNKESADETTSNEKANKSPVSTSRSPRRSTRRSPATDMSTSLQTSPVSSPSRRQSKRLSGISAIKSASTTNKTTGSFTDVTPLINESFLERLEKSRSRSRKSNIKDISEAHGDASSLKQKVSVSEIIDESADKEIEDQYAAQIEEEQDEEENSEDEQEEVTEEEEEDEEEKEQGDKEEEEAEEGNEAEGEGQEEDEQQQEQEVTQPQRKVVDDDVEKAGSSNSATAGDMVNQSGGDMFANASHNESVDVTENTIRQGYDTMQTPQLPSPRKTPASLKKSVARDKSPVSAQKTLFQTKNVRKTAKKKAQDGVGFPRLPRSLTKSIFSHFSKFKVNKQVIDEVEQISDEYWKNIANDLAAYVDHADRVTIEENDIELLMKRQRFITDKQSLHTLIAKYLPLESRSELIPIARSGNVVYPKS